MEIEAALPPPEVRLNDYIRKYSLRLLKLTPTHPVNKELASQLASSSNPTSSNNLQLAKQLASKQTQLIRIYLTTSKLVELDSLETIYTSIFPPGNRLLLTKSILTNCLKRKPLRPIILA